MLLPPLPPGMCQPRRVVLDVLLLFLSSSLVLLLPSLSLSQPNDPSYLLVWQEEFIYANGSQPSSAVWNWDVGNGDWGWGNDELEYYTASTLNSAVYGDVLSISGLYQSDYDSSGFDFTSARLNTQGKLSFYQGYVAARATIDMFNGFWPAMALGNTSSSLGWPFCGEIDFMEQVNGQSASPNQDDFSQFGTLHYNAGGQYATTNSPTQSGGSITSSASMWGSDWHVYAFEWNASSIAFSVDGQVYFAVQTADAAGLDSFRNPLNPFYLILNLAFGGEFPNESPLPSNFPAAFNIDWIRIWQRQDGVSYIVAPNALTPPTQPSSSSSSTALPATIPTSASSSSSSSSAVLPLPASSSSGGSSSTSAISSGSSGSSSSSSASSSSSSEYAVLPSTAPVRANDVGSAGCPSSLPSLPLLLPLLALLALSLLC